jgi:excisionase family DNA binding protein
MVEYHPLMGNSLTDARPGPGYRTGKAVADALSAGTLTRPSCCERCQSEEPLAAHHENYTKPLDVVWLCPSCHAKADHARRRREWGEKKAVVDAHRDWLNAKEVALVLGVSTSAVYRAVANGTLPALRLAEHGAIRIHRSALNPKEKS